MEKARLENKGERLAGELKRQISISSKMLKDAMDLGLEYEKEIIKSMTPKEIEKKKAFDKKYSSLLYDGKLIEAEELKKQYLK